MTEKADLPRLEDYIDYEAYYLPHLKNVSKSGDQVSALCPFHEDNQNSFSLNLKSSQWDCKAGKCGSGNILVFEAKLNGIDTKEAYKKLCRDYKIPLNGNGNGRGRPKEKKPATAPADDTCNIDELFIPEEVWTNTFKLPDAERNYYKSLRGWSAEAIEKLDIRFQTFYRDSKTGQIKKAYKKDRAAIPVRDAQGRLRNIRLYTPKPNGKSPKIFSWGQAYGSTRNFPATPLDPNPEAAVYLMEGEPDTICAVSQGLNAITHTGKLNEYTAELLEPFKNRDVVICYDADIPGQNYALMAAKNLYKVARSVKILIWPDSMGKLPDGTWPAKGGQDFTDFIVRHRQTVADFLALPTKVFTAEDAVAQEAQEKARLAPKKNAMPLQQAIDYLNSRHAVVMLGGRCVILNLPPKE